MSFRWASGSQLLSNACSAGAFDHVVASWHAARLYWELNVPWHHFTDSPLSYPRQMLPLLQLSSIWHSVAARKDHRLHDEAKRENADDEQFGPPPRLRCGGRSRRRSLLPEEHKSANPN